MVHLAFLWHHHQPYYRDPRSGRSALPWVRLHATKDYYGMARLLQEFPKVRATFNIVPSLAEQLERYGRQGAGDAWLDVMEPEAATLAEPLRERAVALGFHANPKTMIARLPRYEALYRKKLAGSRFSAQEILDLQVLSTLAWFHGTLLDEDPVAASLRKKGKDFGEDDKRALLRRSREIAATVLPLYRSLEDREQVEVTTSPYYHPILPLLCDFRSAYEAMPELVGKVEFDRTSLAADAQRQVGEAVRLHEEVFGRRPRGMWPPEGSVSSDVIALAAGAGFQYIATDEEILAHSLGRPIRRDGDGNVLDADLLYRPWRARAGDGEVSIVFRDHRLSDLFGFVYHHDPAGGVRDFLKRLAWIRDRAESPLVTVILDGENAWEHYPEGGTPFFRELYGALEASNWITTVRLGDEIGRRPPGDRLPRLYAGSWIDHSMYTWIGHDEDRAAWRLLLGARAALREEEEAGRLSKEERTAAWEEVLIAEGSDWYWWYGDDKTSGMDDVFDAIFREHVRNIYLAIRRAPPKELEIPICGQMVGGSVTQPTAFLDVRVDGRRSSFFEWLGAGRFRAEDEAGAMSRAQPGSLEEIDFGFSTRSLFLALDFGERIHTIFADGASLHVHFVQPKEQELEILGPGRMRLGAVERSSVAIDEIVELELPWQDLGVGAGEKVRFFVELRRQGLPSERAPRGFAIAVEVPSEDFESRNWAV
jgi:alpha-amylase/alpha-mannosidase (GH57 family)